MRPGTLLRWYALKSILKSEIKDGLIIFDIGSYDGFISYNLKKLFPNLKITVVDIDKSGLHIARERGLNTLYASALKLPIEDNQIDIILCLDLVEHVKKDFKLIKEISRILKEDGKVILTTPVQNGISFPFLSKEKNKTINRDLGHVRKGYSLDDIKKLFENNNLVIMTTNRYFNFFSRFAYWFWCFSGIRLRGKWMLYKLIVMLEPYLKFYTQEHIVVGMKSRGD